MSRLTLGQLTDPPLRAISPQHRGLEPRAGSQDEVRSTRDDVAADASCAAGPAALSRFLEYFPGLSPRNALKESLRLAALGAQRASPAPSQPVLGRRTKADHRALLGRLRDGATDAKIRRGELSRAEVLARVEQRMSAADSAASPVPLRDAVSTRAGERAWRGRMATRSTAPPAGSWAASSNSTPRESTRRARPSTSSTPRQHDCL